MLLLPKVPELVTVPPVMLMVGLTPLPNQLALALFVIAPPLMENTLDDTVPELVAVPAVIVNVVGDNVPPLAFVRVPAFVMLFGEFVNAPLANVPLVKIDTSVAAGRTVFAPKVKVPFTIEVGPQ